LLDKPDFVWAFHDKDEIGPKMLARIAKHTFGAGEKESGSAHEKWSPTGGHLT
jgi:hypothetical protein